MNEELLRRHLEEAHRQLLERDNVYRFHEDELRDRDLQILSRDVQIDDLQKQITELQTWAAELESSLRQLESTIQEMEATTAWRVSNRLRLLKDSARSIAHRGARP